MAQNVEVRQIVRSIVALAPHEFIQVARHHLFARPVHSLEDGFCAAPISLHAISMGPVDWVNEVATVINRAVRVVTGDVG